MKLTKHEQAVTNRYNLMPFNIDQMVEDERTLLGESLIGEAGTVDEIAEIITRPEMFLDPDNRTLWRAVLELNAQGIKPDIVVVSDQLGKAGKDDLKRWQVFAVTLSEAAVSTANVKYHAQVVREAYIRRSLATIGKNMATEASEDKITSPAVLAEESQKAIENVLSGLSGQESYDALGMIDEVRSEWNRPSASPIVTGIQCLDLQLGGLMPGEVFVLAARPSVGKTSFGLTVGLDVATNSTHGGPVAFVSVEMTRRAMMTRLVSLASRIPAFRLKNGETDQRQREAAFAKLKHMLDAGRLFIIDDRIRSTEIVTTVRALIRRHGVKLVIIDYLQLCHASGKHENRNLAVGAMSAEFKALAVRHNVAVMVLSQLSRASARDKRAPALSDLRDSGAIEQDADVIAFLHRKDEVVKHQVTLRVEKNRNGPCLTADLNFNPSIMRFGNQVRSYSAPPKVEPQVEKSVGDTPF